MTKGILLPRDLLCGLFDSSVFGAMRTTPPRVCRMFELEYFTEDGGRTFLNDSSYAVLKDYVHVCHPGDVRHSELPFKTKYLKFNAEGRLAELLLSAPRYFKIGRADEARALLDGIITLYTDEGCDGLLLQARLLEYISLVLSESGGGRPTCSPGNAVVTQAMEYVKEHYGECIRLADIARAVNLSPNYFHTLFTEACGVTPQEFLTDYRVGVARNLLVTTEMSLAEIAERTGFKSQQYLTTVFKARVGLSPARLRREQRSAYLT